MRFFLTETDTALAGHRRLYDELVARDDGISRHIFIVPDRYTLSVERDICEYCFPEGYTRADVVSFTRLAVKTLGKKLKRCLTKEGTVILLGKIIDGLSDRLRYYKNLSGYGFAKELFAAMASLRSGGVTPDDIEARLGDIEGTLADKLSDVALIMREYERALTVEYQDTVTRIDGLIEHVKTEGLGVGVNVYILGFNFFSAQQMELIKALLTACDSVNINFVAGANNLQKDELTAFCAEAGVPVRRERITEKVPEPFGYLGRAMFGNGRIEKHDFSSVRLFSEKTPQEEITAVAREIIYLTKREKYRFKDIAVVCNDNGYLSHVREIFERCGVPCFIDEGYPLLNGIAIKYVLGVMNAAAELSPSAVFKTVSHSFFGLTREQAEAFERYCIKYNIRYTRFNEPFKLGECAEAEEIRRRLTAELARVPREGTTAIFCDYVKTALNTDTVLSELEKLAEEKDERLRAMAHIEEFLHLIDDVKMLIGEERTNLAGFLALIKAAAADMQVTLCPDYYDSVFVGNTSESRFSSVKILFVIGASDGYFPVKSGDGLIFSAADNEAMRRRNLTVFPSPIEKNIFEKFVIRDLVTKPTDRLYIGCAQADFSGEAQSAGEGFDEIAYLIGGTVKPLYTYHGLSGEALLNYKLVNLNNALYTYLSGEVPEEYSDAVKRLLTDNGLLTEHAQSRPESAFLRFFKKEGDMYLTSVSQLENYFSCPYKHFLNYGLRVQEEEDITIRPYVLGNFIHNVLEKFFRTNIQAVYRGEDLSEEIERVIDAEMTKEDYARYLTDAVGVYILNGVRKECRRLIPALTENMRHSDFRPIGFEVGFGYRDGEEEIVVATEKGLFKLHGRIDRVDEYDGNIIIIDYKTGSVKSDLKDIFCGKKIQLFVYMNYYKKKGKRPAGAFYLPIHSGSTAGGRKYSFNGQMVNDPEIYRAIDNRINEAEGKYESPTIALKAENRGGEIKLAKSVGYLSDSEFDAVTLYVERLIQQALKEIGEGYAERKPLKGACEYCIYKKICGPVPARNVYAVKADSFFARLEAETDGEPYEPQEEEDGI